MKRQVTLSLFAAAVVALGACPSAGGRNAVTGRALTDSDLALGATDAANRDSEGFSESVTLRGHIEGGGDIYGRLLVTNLGPADQKARLRLDVKFGADDLVSVRASRDRGKWSTESGKLVADMGESGRLEATVEGLRWRVSNAKAEIDITVEPTLAPLMPAGGTADFGKGKYYRTTLLVPHGKVTGKVVTKGEGGSEREISGWVYAEKRTGNVAPYMMAKRFVNAFDITREGTFAASAFQRSPAFGGSTQGWMLLVRGGEVAAYAPEVDVRTDQAVPDSESGYSVPKVVILESQAAGLQAVIKATDLTRRMDDLASLSKIERFFAERFAKPFSFVHSAAWLVKRDGSSDGAVASGKGEYTYSQLK